MTVAAGCVCKTIHSDVLFLARITIRYAMVAVVGTSSVVRCSFRGHISKTKQDGPIVTIEHF